MLSKNFALSEFTASSTADRLGIPNQPAHHEVIALTALANVIMQPIRNKWGRLIITSGFRGTPLNAAIGGVSNSQHATGNACDFVSPDHDLMDICEWIVNESGLEWDQLILEENAGGSRWVHISYNHVGENRKQVMSAYVDSNGKAQYRQGLH